MEESKTSYKHILKSTFLFGFVQIFNILIKIIISKSVALFLGTEGMGLIGIYNSTVNLFKSFAGLGISQSAVKDIAENNVAGETEKRDTIITIVNKLILFTGLLGGVVIIIMSPYLSKTSFGTTEYTLPFILLSIVVFLTIINEGQLAILKGLRMLRILAKASLWGAFVGLFVSVPLYYIWGLKGIIPSLIAIALVSVTYSSYYVKKVGNQSRTITVKETLRKSLPMIKMGLALMYLSLAGILSEFIVKIFISHTTGIDSVGIFQAGSTIIIAYFGIITTALTTDYYPRISAVNQNNSALTDEVNRQTTVGLLLIFPLIIIFLFLMPVFIRLLYSPEFLRSTAYLQFAVFGILLNIGSNSMGMILLAKQASHTFVWTTTIITCLTIGLNIALYYFYGLPGLGISTIVIACMHMGLMTWIMKRQYGIRFERRVISMYVLVILLCILAFFTKDIHNSLLRYSTGGVLAVLSILYTLTILKKSLGINLIYEFKKRLNKAK